MLDPQSTPTDPPDSRHPMSFAFADIVEQLKVLAGLQRETNRLLEKLCGLADDADSDDGDVDADSHDDEQQYAGG